MPTKRTGKNGKKGSTALQKATPSPAGMARAARNLLEGALAGRLRFMERAGIQYGGNRDIYATAGYITPGKERFDDYWGLYVRNEIAGRIVDMPAKTTWRTPPEVYEEQNDEVKDTAFTKAFTALSKRLKLWRYFERVDRLAGIGQYAVMLLGVKGTDDRAMAQPLERLQRPEDIIYLGVYHEQNAPVVEWVTDAGNERYGLPKTYDIQLSNGLSGFPKASVRVDASRVIHVAEDLLLDDVFGRPRLQRALNRLFDLDKVSAASAESFWQAASRVLAAQLDPEAAMSDTALDAMKDAMAEMVHDLRREFVGQGAELKWLPATAEPPKEVADFYFALISAASGIPRRILFGNEVGELASTTDEATYFGMINERQEHFAEPQILRAFIDRLVTIGALPQPTTTEYEVEWPSLFELTELEQADANLKRAQAAATLTPTGGDPLQLVEIDEDRNVWLVPREAMTPEEIAAANAPLPPLPGVPNADGTPNPAQGATGDQAQPTGAGQGTKAQPPTQGGADIQTQS